MADSPAKTLVPELLRGPRRFNEPWSSRSAIADCFLLPLDETDGTLGADFADGADVEGGLDVAAKCEGDKVAVANGENDDDMGIDDDGDG
jgi:hypothetical protein